MKVEVGGTGSGAQAAREERAWPTWAEAEASYFANLPRRQWRCVDCRELAIGHGEGGGIPELAYKIGTCFHCCMKARYGKFITNLISYLCNK